MAAQLNKHFEKTMLNESDNRYLINNFNDNTSLFDTIPDDCKNFDLAAVMMSSDSTKNSPADYATHFITNAGCGVMDATLFSALSPKLYRNTKLFCWMGGKIVYKSCIDLRFSPRNMERMRSVQELIHGVLKAETVQ